VASGLALAQVGEFSFVLAGVGVSLGLLGAEHYQLFLGASVLTMIFAPFAVGLAERIGDLVAGVTPQSHLMIPTQEMHVVRALEDHVIIVGYGLNGRNLARALDAVGVRYVVLEQNGQVVRRARLERAPVFFGDGSRAEVLERVGIARARVIVFAIAAPAESRRGVAAARHRSPNVRIVVRTRYVSEIEELSRLGADEVVPEEFETSLEIFSRVLRRYGVPTGRIREVVDQTRRDHYEVFRVRETAMHPIPDLLGAQGQD
jgi:CPA2 family monovalent cation:H+ antiporter-2